MGSGKTEISIILLMSCSLYEQCLITELLILLAAHVSFNLYYKKKKKRKFDLTGHGYIHMHVFGQVSCNLNIPILPSCTGLDVVMYKEADGHM